MIANPLSSSMIAKVRESMRESWNRFPLVFCFAFLATAFGIYAVVSESDLEQVYQLQIALVFGISLSLAMYHLDYLSQSRTLVTVASILLCAAAYVAQRNEIFTVFSVRWVQLFFMTHLLCAFSPFVQEQSATRFWNYNKDLLVAFLLATVFAGTIFVGTSAALGSIQYLFDIENRNWMKCYPIAWIVCAFFIHPLIFLHTLHESEGVDRSTEFKIPKPLTVFCTYILVPFVFLYLFILYNYEVKIFFSKELPKGLVSWLVCTFGSIGILAWLLSYPLGRQHTKGVILFFHRHYFKLFIPLLILLWIAVVERISTYGFTEFRYLLLTLTIWITAITVIFSVRYKAPIKLIPISLFFITFFATYGPLSAYSISFYSQMGRLHSEFLSKNNCQPNTEEFSRVELKSITSILKYLAGTHPLKTLEQLKEKCQANPKALSIIDQYIAKDSTARSRGSRYSYRNDFAADFLHIFGLVPVSEYETITTNDTSQISFTARSAYSYRVFDIEGLRTFIDKIYIDRASGAVREYQNGQIALRLQDSSLLVTIEDKTLTVDLTSFISNLPGNHGDARIPDEDLILNHTEQGVRIRIFFEHLKAKRQNQQLILHNLNFAIAIGKEE